MTSAAAAVPPPGQRSGPSGAAELFCALSYGSGLAVAERMAHGTSTALAGAGNDRAVHLEAADTAGMTAVPAGMKVRRPLGRRGRFGRRGDERGDGVGLR